jgi:hypothetical protein
MLLLELALSHADAAVRVSALPGLLEFRRRNRWLVGYLKQRIVR